MRQLSRLCLAITSLCVTTQTMASDFNLPFVNTAGLGVAYADWASAATDASTAYTNPAGLVNLPQKQMVINALGITGTTLFTGSAQTPSFPFPLTVSESGKAHSGINVFTPSFYFGAPISNRLAFGLSVTAPFGLGTNYGTTSVARYTATRSKVLGLDFSPSVGVKLNDFVSVGAGFDALHLGFTLNNMYGPPLSIPTDTSLQNHLGGWGYGWHAGTLFALSSETRIGLSFNSKISLSTTGYSTTFTPFNNQEFRTNNQRTDASLPARLQLSAQHDLTKRWTAMSTIFYTNWKTFRQLTMQQTQTPFGQPMSVTIPFNYHNCLDYSIGATFKANEQWLLRGGIQFMNTPSNNQDRGIADPIGSATILAVGAHFKASEVVNFDLGVGHSFFKQMPINFSNAVTSLRGHTNTQTTVIGGQINWNIT